MIGSTRSTEPLASLFFVLKTFHFSSILPPLHAMSRNKYYDLSSDNDSDDVSFGSESSNDDVFAQDDSSAAMVSGQDPLWGRTIVHLDIDCFYVQAEEIERGLRDSGRPIPPLAIGQKHIIVSKFAVGLSVVNEECFLFTGFSDHFLLLMMMMLHSAASNYLARSMGVKKLQSKREALETCPTLWIVDGSDLRHYRKHSRAVYQAFRLVMEELYRKVFGDPSSSAEYVMKHFVPCMRGCMDEMMGDMSKLVNKLVAEPDGGRDILAGLLTGNATQQKLHIFGEDSRSSVAHIVEDQTGASVTISLSNDRNGGSVGGRQQLSQSRRNVHDAHHGDRLACHQRFQVATHLGQYICNRIQQRTQFHTTIGLSVSPMLAKLAGGLSKPKAINVLLPWRTADLMYGMPLRKLPNVGHRTMKVLDSAIREEVGEKQTDEAITVG
jgi:impB/mucB/samB family